MAARAHPARAAIGLSWPAVDCAIMHAIAINHSSMRIKSEGAR
jgi:hypothetical protein